MDRWDRRLVIVGANIGRLILIAGIGTILAFEAGDLLLLFVALLANGLARFVASGLSASLPHVVPREQVVTMNWWPPPGCGRGVCGRQLHVAAPMAGRWR